MLNKNSRFRNIVYSSTFGVIEQFISYFSAFLYRTFFLMILTKNYLGISGFFTNVLQIFSLAELGVGSVISYHMYKPIKENNIKKCAALLNFYKTVYRFLFFLIIILGLIFYPFLGEIIADSSEIPSDVSLNMIYWMFVFQSASTYLCVYSQSLLNADQRGYIVSFANSIYMLISNILKIIILFLSNDYSTSLFFGIIINIVYNVILHFFVKKHYKDIFSKREQLTSEEKISIFKDSMGLLCHRIGYTIMNSTDSIILSKYIGISTLGLYSNYSLITTALDTTLNKLLGSFVSSIGNMSIDLSKDELYKTYKNFFFLNLWISSFCTICLFVLINPFIELWLDKSYLLGYPIVIIISLNLFINSSRIINNAYVNATGLFIKDRLRPLIQAILNLIISIALVKSLDISGVFIGTILSTLLTCWWREPIIMYKYIFERNLFSYFIYYIKWTLLTISVAGIVYSLSSFFSINLFGFTMKMITCLFFTNLIYFIVFRKSSEFVFFCEFFKRMIERKSK